MKEATEKEIELCLEEARRIYPEATELELWKLAIEIYQDISREFLTPIKTNNK